MKTTYFSLQGWVLCLAVVLLVGEASGLVIYRFGGEGLDPPPEAGNTGVEFIQLDWENLDSGLHGQAVDVAINASGVRPQKRDPSFNITPSIETQGGNAIRPQTNGQVWDGDTGTTWIADRYLCAEFSESNYFLFCEDDFGTPGTANIFLGTPHIIDRIRIISGLNDQSKTVQAARVFIGAELTRQAVYHHPRPALPWLVEVRDNRDQVLDIPIPSHEAVEIIQVTLAEHNESWEVHEIEIYAKGFVDQAAYISNIIDFGRPMAWGDLRWTGIQDPQARVLIQTRSGLDDDPELFWRFTGRGDEKALVERADYGKLKLAEKAGIGYDQVNWTFWSAPYDFADSSGAAVVSLSPRRYFQFKVDFLPQDNDGGQVDFLELRASEPVATNLVGEVWPIEALVGQTTQFTYALRPTIRAEDGGFDRLEIETSSLIQSVQEVRIGDGAVAYEVEVQEPHRLAVRFSPLEARDSGALIEVEFEAQVLRYGATFSARVSDSARPLEVPQGVNVGDATAAYEGNRVAVATSVGKQSLLQVVVPAVFTPNGDGSNDEVGISYAILEITATAQVEVVLLDLSGRSVRRVYAGSDGIGEYERRWDGRDEAGQLMPPGIYLYRVSVDVDREKVEKIGVVNVVY